MSHNIELLEGAFVISDAHYSDLRPELLALIKDIHSKKLLPSQIVFMGDIFDALFGEVPYTHSINEEMITLINEINQEIEVIYLEGNHDFNLESVFPNAKIFSLNEQPVSCNFKGKKVCLAHGDFDVSLSYSIYSGVIRNSTVLSTLKIIDNFTNHYILKKLDSFLAKKDDCKEFIGFRDFISKRELEKFECDYFIEGHFHQNSAFSFDNFYYINLAAFACNQRYFIVESSDNKELLKEEKFSKEI
ncbi:UDP-2,3-diacylglucosamine hydrolase [Sulfurimonas aquatica]|uniref:UDP-2,3-diacylglucosamine hydrolase n=1 Tax=Sulfurimonas aquatica TaxID=2672570 RepID=A0A975GC21_9BACT|nr:metallophosphoesterase [Sulfurimonas aquatica]QSZ41165.1 UDP-2,3-diacylglucosamine hydrolase [Sulfurimonas aquatica]